MIVSSILVICAQSGKIRHEAFTATLPVGWKYERRKKDKGRIRFALYAPGKVSVGAIDYQPSAQGVGSPMEDFLKMERAFQKRSGYRRLQLESKWVNGSKAAVWEFMIGTGSDTRHTLDVGFDKVAVLFRVKPEEWDAYWPGFRSVLVSMGLRD